MTTETVPPERPGKNAPEIQNPAQQPEPEMPTRRGRPGPDEGAPPTRGPEMPGTPQSTPSRPESPASPNQPGL